MSVKESPLLKEFKTFLQATLVAFGSDGALFSLVNQKFSEDWVGSPSLKEYAKKFGYGGSKGVLKLLESMPDQVTILLNSTGEVVLKPVPMEETRDNLAKIDETNKEIKTEKMRRQQSQRHLPAAVTAHLAASMVPGWPSQVPAHPLASLFNASIKRVAVGPHPPSPPKKKINPNLIPLGPPSFACPNANNFTSNTNESVGKINDSASARLSDSASNLKDGANSSKGSVNDNTRDDKKSAIGCVEVLKDSTNDSGKKTKKSSTGNDGIPKNSTNPAHNNQSPTSDVSENQQNKSPQKSAKSATDQRKKSPQKSTVQSATANEQRNLMMKWLPSKIKKVTFVHAMRYMEREAWKRAERRSDAYYEEDFRTLASPRNESPEPRPAEEAKAENTTNSGDKRGKRPAAPPPATDENCPSAGEGNSETEANEWGESDFDEDNCEGFSTDGWDFVDKLSDSDVWPGEEEHKECAVFLRRFVQLYTTPVPGGIYRLVRVFRRNGGSFSRIDLLEKKFLDTYGIRLSRSERNRLLGAPATIRIAKDSFSRAAYPGLFRVSERVSSGYGLSLLPCLAGPAVDPSSFLSPFSHLPSRPSTATAAKRILPMPTTPATHAHSQRQNQRTAFAPSDNSQVTTHLGGLKIESVLSAYAHLLHSLKEPPLSPPFNVGQLLLFRHDQFGVCHGRIVGQDSRHLAVKHLDTQKVHHVEMASVYAFPNELLKEHSKKVRSCSTMACQPGTPFIFIVPTNVQQFRCF